MGLPKAPFEIGQELWLPLGTPRQITLPCPVCFGNKGVIVEFGNGERVCVECDGCGHGFEGPRGFITEYEHAPDAIPFVVKDVEYYRNGEWNLLSTDARRADYASLRATREEALLVAKKHAEDLLAANMEQRRSKRQRGATKATWDARYHGGQIKDLERQLAWHRKKLAPLEQEHGRDDVHPPLDPERS